MPSAKRDITPISGEEAGRTILLDLAQWADNMAQLRPSTYGRKTSAELSEMLYGLQTNEDVQTYDSYRRIQDLLHKWWNDCEKTSREARIEWLKLAREYEFIALAAVHDDEMLAIFKPKHYLEHEILTNLYDDIRRYAHSNDAQCAAVRLLCEELNMPELLSLQFPLKAFKPEDAASIINMAIERLNNSAFEGAKELAEFILDLPEFGENDFIDQNVTRRAKAVMKQKKPLLHRLMSAKSVFLGLNRS